MFLRLYFMACTNNLGYGSTFCGAINPDFSQVEVDQQVTNLDRFEIFFPERRQFFLENADLFGGFGTPRANPFFSRRIGIAQDTSTGNNIQNPILFGARLSGKLDNYWRLGILNMQTAADAENDLPSFNYAVAAVQRRIGMRSNVGVIFVNKESFGSDDNMVLMTRATEHLGWITIWSPTTTPGSVRLFCIVLFLLPNKSNLFPTAFASCTSKGLFG